LPPQSGQDLKGIDDKGQTTIFIHRKFVVNCILIASSEKMEIPETEELELFFINIQSIYIAQRYIYHKHKHIKCNWIK